MVAAADEISVGALAYPRHRWQVCNRTHAAACPDAPSMRYHDAGGPRDMEATLIGKGELSTGGELPRKAESGEIVALGSGGVGANE